MPEQQPDLRRDLGAGLAIAAISGVAAGLTTVASTRRPATMPARYAGSFFERESHARTTT
jgi:hypothetical protein